MRGTCRRRLWKGSTTVIVGVAAFTFAIGCRDSRPRESRSYKIVEIKHYTERRNGQDLHMISFVLRHNGITVKAHCEASNAENKCEWLRVGQSYDFKDTTATLLILGNFTGGGGPALLVIDEESMDK
jgi:hypothetical protein